MGRVLGEEEAASAGCLKGSQFPKTLGGEAGFLSHSPKESGSLDSIQVISRFRTGILMSKAQVKPRTFSGYLCSIRRNNEAVLIGCVQMLSSHINVQISERLIPFLLPLVQPTGLKKVYTPCSMKLRDVSPSCPSI